jgi:hypothetical protein
MIAFGVVTGMQFDGGGSSTMVARVPGDAYARVQNSPSDGVERRVGDALLVYSNAPNGAAARIYSAPQIVRAMPGAHVPVRIAITDAAGHPTSCGCNVHMRVIPGDAGRLVGDTFVAGRTPQDAKILLDAGTLHADVPVRVTASPAYVEVLPQNAAVLNGQSVQLQARAFDAHGYPIALPEQLPWSTSTGRIDESGYFTAQNSDARVDVKLGTARASELVTVGEHDAPLPLARYVQFATAPHNQAGGVDKDAPCPQCLSLRYDFTGDERAAYANASIPLPQRALGIAADVFGDGNGEILRLAVNNAINERFLYTVATVNWHGWRHVELRFPPALPQPITFKSLYVINRVGPGTPVQAAGSIAVRNLHVVLAGSASNSPK